MNKKHFLFSTLISVALLTIVFAPLTSSYDPWIDYNEDGTVDVSDLSSLGQAYGSSGDPTKNVNVTNWPEPKKQLFPENLLLQGALFEGEVGTEERHDLIGLDEYTYYPPQREPGIVPYDDPSYLFLWSTKVLLFNETYVHQKIALEPSRILGMPAVYIAFNMSNSWWTGTPITYVKFLAYLGVVTAIGEWEELAFFGNDTWRFTQEWTYPEFQGNAILTNRTNIPLDIWIDPNNRLAIRILIYVWATGGEVTSLSLKIPYRRYEYDFMVDIPIVKNP